MPFSGLEKVSMFLLAVLLFVVAKTALGFLYRHVVGPAVNKVDFRKMGRWALVTGSTDGIGKAYAKALAAKGCDIILVSRSLDKLKAVAEEIEKEWKVQTLVVQADFTSSEDIYQRIAQQTDGLEIGTLVNNVGMSYDHPEYYLQVPTMDVENILKANVCAVTRMCRLVMPAMVARGCGVVINIGSASSMLPAPLLAVYAASKAYVEKFTEALDQEYSKKGLIIQCVVPGFVVSNMSKLRKSTFMAPSAESFVASALTSVGTVSKTTGYLPHSLLVLVVDAISAVSSGLAVWIVTRTNENTKMRALKKKQKQKLEPIEEKNLESTVSIAS